MWDGALRRDSRSGGIGDVRGTGSTDDAFFDALVRGDAERLEEVLGSDFTIVDIMRGGQADRATFIEAVASRQVVFQAKEPPAGGIALIIASDKDPLNAPPGSAPSPPLSLDEFMAGSAPAGSPTLDVMWFSGDGQTFLATVKTGPDATSADIAAMEAVVGSVRFESGGTG